MSLGNQTTLGDYAPQPRRRQLSRGRKALIGLMAIGAFAAVGGAGTFASFTASTDNAGGGLGDGNNPFETPNFELSNRILSRSDGSGPETACLSSNDLKTFPDVNPPQLVDAAGDNAAYCDALFLFDDFATTATADLALENTGDSDGDLVLYAVDVDATGGVQTCKLDATAGTNDLCGDWELSVQEYAIGATPLSGSAAPDFGNDAERVAACAIPSAAAVCGTNSTVFSSLPQLAAATTIGSLPFDDDGPVGGVLNNDVRYFKVTAVLPPDAGCTDANTDGYNDLTGLGCHNYASDGSATLQLRWVLRG